MTVAEPRMYIYRKFGLPSSGMLLFSAFLFGNMGLSAAQAQVIIPNGLGSEVSDGFCSTSCTITGGSRAEPHSPNLFHSFGQFSIPDAATATLQHDADIGRIFLRVTDAPSFLDGQLATDVGGSPGHADLFLLNPQGIVFGPHASLDIGGSFLATTAEQVQFGEGATAFRVQDDHPVLSVNVPIGLQLGASAGSISVGSEQSPGPGHGLFLNGRDFSVNRSLRPTGLAVPEGETLALIGQHLNLWGSNVTAAAGRIELASLASNQFVALLPSQEGWQLNYTLPTQFSDINLHQAASLDVSGDKSGQLHLQGNSVNLSGGSVLLSQTLGSGTGGLIEVDATTINLVGISSAPLPGPLPFFFPISTGIFADLAPEQLGMGGDVKLIAQILNLEDGARVSTSTFGVGFGGELSVQADFLNVEGSTPFGFSSGLLAVVGPEALGQGGQVKVKAEKILLQKGGGIVASTFGEGDAGSIIIEGGQVDVLGANVWGASTIQSVSFPSAQGQGGEIQINVNHLKVALGGQISTSTGSSGRAGRLEIDATELVEITGRNQFTSNGSEPARSGLFSSAIVGSGKAGDIIVTSPSLIVEQGGVISVSNFPSIAGLPPGTGPSGDILIAAGEVILDGDAGLNSRTQFDADGPGGANINIQANSILMSNDSFINASSERTAGGGNITIQTPFLVALPNTDSDITASANTGDGGNIQISAQGILGLAIRPAVLGNGTNDIDASSQAGADGTVSTTGLDSDEHLELDAIPDDPRDVTKLVGSACNGPSQAGGQFIITGRGGIAPLPSDTHSGQMPLIEFDGALIDSLAFTPELPAASDSQLSLAEASSPTTPPPLAEAQAWTINEDNQITLVADHGALLPQADYSPCHTAASA